MLTDKLTASAIGARTARACDSCMIRRARWFCPSDDAFLCHTCDISVHSANQLASRHERVLISTTTTNTNTNNITSDWHQKVTRRARTPRNNAAKAKSIEIKLSSSLEVPEIGYEEEMSCENELMVFQVPVLDAECGFWNEDESASVEELHSLLEFVPDDIQFNDETMNGGVGMDFICNVELEMLGCVEGKKVDQSRVKMEEEIKVVLACEYDMDLIDSTSRESLLDWDFGFECDEMAIKAEDCTKAKNGDGGEEVAFGKGMLLLKLNCDEVVSSWNELCCPWVNGIRPEFDLLGDGWPQLPGIKDSSSGHGAMDDESGGRSVREGRVMSEERVARVTRYREKRRTRLFSKKIRYEVRKLNAEKRPRMKGRFCKRVQSYLGPQVTGLK